MSLYETILESLRAKVESGEWPRGAMIPREMDLCAQYGVSRSTIRTAMSHLVNEGLLKRVKGVGTYVADEKRVEKTTLFIDSFSHELKKRGQNTCTELMCFCCVPAIREVNEALRLPAEARLLRITRLRYAQGAFEKGPIVLSTSYFRAEFQTFFQEYDLEKTSLRAVLKAHGYTRAVFDKRLSAQQLGDRDCHLMGVPVGALAICITSVALDSHGRELEYTVSLYPQDKNEFELRVKM